MTNTREQKRRELAELADAKHRHKIEAAKEAIGALTLTLQAILEVVHNEHENRYDRSHPAVEELVEQGLMTVLPTAINAYIPQHVQQALDELKSEDGRPQQGRTTPGAQSSDQPGDDVPETGEEAQEQDSSEEDGDDSGEPGDDGDGDGDGSDGDSGSEDEDESGSDQEQVIWRVSGIPK